MRFFNKLLIIRKCYNLTILLKYCKIYGYYDILILLELYMSVLEIKNLTHRYDDKFIFNDASLTINNGEHIGVVGLNGAGKSTFINIIADKLSYDEGEVILTDSFFFRSRRVFSALSRERLFTRTWVRNFSVSTGCSRK